MHRCRASTATVTRLEQCIGSIVHEGTCHVQSRSRVAAWLSRCPLAGGDGGWGPPWGDGRLGNDGPRPHLAAQLHPRQMTSAPPPPHSGAADERRMQYSVCKAPIGIATHPRARCDAGCCSKHESSQYCQSYIILH